MSTPGSMAMTIMLFSVSAAMHLGAGCFSLLLCFGGILVGANLVAMGVRMAEGPAPILPVVIADARALTVFVRRNIATVGLIMASSCAFMALFDEEDPVLCFSIFALFLLGLVLISIGARGE